MNETRRELLLGAAALALAACQTKPVDAGPATHPDGRVETLQQWLAKNVVPVRSVDANDEDFSDLEPIAPRIANARIVQLGEPGHGAGTAFAAKVRLIKFLHSRLGFDVVAWESGFYDVERTEAGLKAGLDAVASAQRGILRIWSASEECRPLFEFAQKSHLQDRPLTMAGFDMQFTSSGAFADFAIELKSFVGALRRDELRRDSVQATNEAVDAFSSLSAYSTARTARATELSRAGTTGAAMGDALAAWERETGASLRARRDSLERLQRATDRLLELLGRQPEAFSEVAGARKFEFMTRAVANLAGYGVHIHELYGVERATGPEAELARENRRDKLNADNLRWLIERGYPSRKIIVWAHNAHVMNAYYKSDWKNVSLDPAADAMKPTGVYIAEQYGPKVYTIGFTTYEGEDRLVGNPLSAVPPASEGSIEERLHNVGQSYAFLDIRSARQATNHPLGGPQRLRVPKYTEIQISDVTRPFDAIFYIARMQPATLLR